MSNQNLDNILKDNVDIAKNSLKEADRKALKNLDKMSLKTELDNIQIEWQNIKDVVLAIWANGDSFSNGGWALNSLETRWVSVNGKIIKIGQKSEAMILIQSFLEANGQQLNKYGADGWMGGETQGAAYRFYIENLPSKGQNTGPKTPNNTPEKVNRLNTMDIKDLTEILSGIDYSVIQDYIKTPDMIKKFSRAVSNNIMWEWAKFQNTMQYGNGYFTINGNKVTMDIKIANTNNKLKGIKGKIFSVDLSNCISNQWTKMVDINKEKFTEALYTTINKMYHTEILGDNLYSKAWEIEVKYKTILASKDAAITKYVNIDQLIGELKELKKTAEELKKSSGTTEYDGFILWRNKDISDYLNKSNEYKRLSIANRIDEVYRNNKTKLWEITEARKNFLNTEKNELEKIQIQLSVFKQNGVYTWYENQYNKIKK